MEVWYEVGKWKEDIHKVEAERSTEKFIVVRRPDGKSTRRDAKVTAWNQYFETHAEAAAYVLDRARKRVEDAERVLAAARAKLEYAEATYANSAPLSAQKEESHA